MIYALPHYIILSFSLRVKDLSFFIRAWTKERRVGLSVIGSTRTVLKQQSGNGLQSFQSKATSFLFQKIFMDGEVSGNKKTGYDVTGI